MNDKLLEILAEYLTDQFLGQASDFPKDECLKESNWVFSKVLSYYASLVGEGELLDDGEIKKEIKYLYAHNPHLPIEAMLVALCKSVAKAQAAKSKAIEMSKQRRVGQAIKEATSGDKKGVGGTGFKMGGLSP